MALPGKRGNESDKAYTALVDYCQMGAGRSLSSLVDRYRTATEPPPTKREKTIKDWSRLNEWQTRVAAYDADVQAEAEERLKAHRAAVMEEGLALDFERVRMLGEVAHLLFGEVLDEKKRWGVTIKVEGGEGEESTEIVTTRLFNKGLLSEWRGSLDDIAKEVGGRKIKQEFTGKDGGAIEINDSGNVTDEQRAERLVALANRVRARTG